MIFQYGSEPELIVLANYSKTIGLLMAAYREYRKFKYPPLPKDDLKCIKNVYCNAYYHTKVIFQSVFT